MKKINIKILATTAMLISLSFVLSNIKIFKMPFGGSITLFSMFFIVLPGFLYGSFIGIISAFIYSLLQLIFGGYILNFAQVLFDYIFAFTSLGLFNLFYKKNNSIVLSYSVAVFLRFVFSALSGYIFFKEYAPESFHPLTYSVIYNGFYIIGEMIITDIFLLLPIVNKYIFKIKKIVI